MLRLHESFHCFQAHDCEQQAKQAWLQQHLPAQSRFQALERTLHGGTCHLT